MHAYPRNTRIERVPYTRNTRAMHVQSAVFLQPQKPCPWAVRFHLTELATTLRPPQCGQTYLHGAAGSRARWSRTRLSALEAAIPSTAKTRLVVFCPHRSTTWRSCLDPMSLDSTLQRILQLPKIVRIHARIGVIRYLALRSS